MKISRIRGSGGGDKVAPVSPVAEVGDTVQHKDPEAKKSAPRKKDKPRPDDPAVILKLSARARRRLGEVVPAGEEDKK